jgi:hypothetical protein
MGEALDDANTCKSVMPNAEIGYVMLSKIYSKTERKEDFYQNLDEGLSNIKGENRRQIFMDNVKSSPFASGERYEDILEKHGINE